MLLGVMGWIVKVLVAQSCPTLCDSTHCRPPIPSVHGILQARILEWVAIPFSWGSSQPKDQNQVSGIAGWFSTIWATREAWIVVSEVVQSCPTLCNPMDCSLPHSSIHGILLARILPWVAISFSGWIVVSTPPPNFVYWNPHPQHLGMWLYLDMEVLRGNYGKMRLFGWTLIPHDWCPCKRRFGHRCTQREDDGTRPKEKAAICKPRRSFIRKQPCRLLGLGLPACTPVRR